MMRKQAILTILCMLLMATVAQASTFTLQVGDGIVSSDACMDRLGPLQFGVAAMIEYNVESSNIFKDFDVDFGDHWVGPIVKLHALPEDSPVALYVAYAPMFANADPSQDAYEVVSAAIELYGFGVCYQRYLDEYKMSSEPNNDRLLFSWTGKF